MFDLLFPTACRQVTVDCPKLETYKRQRVGIMGEQAAGMIAMLAAFEVTEVTAD